MQTLRRQTSCKSSYANPGAFSLTELFIVLAIIAVLAALIVPKVVQHRQGIKTGDPHELTVILSTNGVTVYRFYDEGNYHYFVDARGSIDARHVCRQDSQHAARRNPNRQMK